jgi:predicted PurR-regulated permease PerM
MAIAALVAVGVVLLPLVPVLVAASWMAHVARPLQRRLTRLFRGRSSAGAVVTAAVVLVPLVPIAIASPLLAGEASALGAALRSGTIPTERLRAVAGLEGQDLVERVVQRFGSHALGALTSIFSASALVVIQVLVFVAALYGFLVCEEEVSRWTRRHVPLDDAIFDRLARAFHETGRGVFCGIAATALVQGVIAGLVFAAFGVPGAFGLGLLTSFASLVPLVGTALVWAPVAIGMAASGMMSRAIALSVTCAIFVGGIDNVLKPLLSRWARLELPATVLLVAMLSGILAMGPWGLVLGPLVVRMAFEIFAIARDLRVFQVARDDGTRAPSLVPPPPESGAQPVARPSRSFRASPSGAGGALALAEAVGPER